MNRNYRIDAIRCFGTLLVILAHVSALPRLVSEVRTFDVVALVMVSGMSFAYSKPIPYGSYVLKRIKRLLVPTYICITVVFLLSFLVCTVLGRQQLFDIRTMLFSYALLDHGMGYIWITKVYLIIALLSPLLKRIDGAIRNDYVFLLVAAAVMIFNHLIIQLLVGSGVVLYMDYLAYVLPYATVFAVGYRWVNADRKFQLTSLCMSLAFFCLFLALHGFQPSESKYPPDYGYIAYGVLVGSVLLLVLPNRRNKYVEYISRNSFTIYLIHILVLFGYNLVRDKVRLAFLSNFVVEYVVVIAFSIALNFCLLLVWDKMKRRTIHGNQELPEK